jgi:hypothetical protein
LTAAVLPAVLKRIIQRKHLAGLKLAGLALTCFQNLCVATGNLFFYNVESKLQEICYPLGEKDLNSLFFKTFHQIQKLLALNG